MLSIQQVYISKAESRIFTTIDSAGQLIKMAVIWLETFHNQFDVSDRKRYIPVHGAAPTELVPTCCFSVFRLSQASHVSPQFFFCSGTRSFLLFYFHSLNRRSALKTDTILIIKAGCDSRTLWQTNFDGKSMPCLSSGCRYLYFPPTFYALSFSCLFFFVYGNLRGVMGKYFLASLILFLNGVFTPSLPNSSFYLFLYPSPYFSLFLLIFLSLFLASIVWQRLIFPLIRRIVQFSPRDFHILWATSPRWADTAWKTR